MAEINGACPQGQPSASAQDLPEESYKVVCDLSLILGDDSTDGARVGNNHMCYHLATICDQKQ